MSKNGKCALTRYGTAITDDIHLETWYMYMNTAEAATIIAD